MAIYFDIINLSNYDLILGTPWLFQHQVCVRFNPARVVIGSDVSTELKGPAVTNVASRSLTVDADEIELRMFDRTAQRARADIAGRPLDHAVALAGRSRRVGYCHIFSPEISMSCSYQRCNGTQDW